MHCLEIAFLSSVYLHSRGEPATCPGLIPSTIETCPQGITTPGRMAAFERGMTHGRLRKLGQFGGKNTDRLQALCALRQWTFGYVENVQLIGRGEIL